MNDSAFSAHEADMKSIAYVGFIENVMAWFGNASWVLKQLACRKGALSAKILGRQAEYIFVDDFYWRGKCRHSER